MKKLMEVDEFFVLKDKATIVMGKHDFSVDNISELKRLTGKKVLIKSPTGIEFETLIHGVEAKPVCFGPPEAIMFGICFKETIEEIQIETGTIIYLMECFSTSSI